MFQNMTIGKKLFSSIGAALAIALMMGAVTIVCISRVNASIDQAYTRECADTG